MVARHPVLVILHMQGHTENPLPLSFVKLGLLTSSNILYAMVS